MAKFMALKKNSGFNHRLFCCLLHLTKQPPCFGKFVWKPFILPFSSLENLWIFQTSSNPVWRTYLSTINGIRDDYEGSLSVIITHILPSLFKERKHLIYNFIMCCLCECRVLNVFSQKLQGRTIPSKWLASMWSLMATFCPSFPHTLQILVLLLSPSFPTEIIFGLFSIIEFTFSSSLKRWSSEEFSIFATTALLHWKELTKS